MRKHGILLLMLAAAVIFSTIPAAASTFVAIDTKDLVNKSDQIVQGKVTETESFWDETGRVIVTEALIQVEDTLAGKAESWVRVRTFGGEVDGYTVEAHGFPKFEVGERLVVFLENPDNLNEASRVMAYQQGHFRIVEQDGVEKAVSTADGGGSLLSLTGDLALAPHFDSLDDLRQQVRNLRADRK
ncbi:MAG: hypothetical protein AAF604_20150 [Acidobacteriota bacterium]